MKLTRKGFFGTFAAAIFGVPVVAKAVRMSITASADTMRVGDVFTIESVPIINPSRFDVLYGIGKLHPVGFTHVVREARTYRTLAEQCLAEDETI